MLRSAFFSQMGKHQSNRGIGVLSSRVVSIQRQCLRIGELVDQRLSLNGYHDLADSTQEISK